METCLQPEAAILAANRLPAVAANNRRGHVQAFITANLEQLLTRPLPRATGSYSSSSPGSTKRSPAREGCGTGVMGGGQLAQFDRVGAKCWWQVGQLTGDRASCWGLASSAGPSSAVV